MGNGICGPHLIQFPGMALNFIRRDKKLYKTEPIKKWVVVIFETQRFFNQDAVADMIKGFIAGAQGVGGYLSNVVFKWLV